MYGGEGRTKGALVVGREDWQRRPRVPYGWDFATHVSPGEVGATDGLARGASEGGRGGGEKGLAATSMCCQGSGCYEWAHAGSFLRTPLPMHLSASSIFRTMSSDASLGP